MEISTKLAANFRKADKPLFDIYQNLKRIPTKEEFFNYNIEERHIDTFLGTYLYKWWVLSLRLDEPNKFRTSEEVLTKLDIVFPPDKYFFQLGIPHLDIPQFKRELLKGNAIIAINKINGWSTGDYSFRNLQGYFNMWKSKSFYRFRKSEYLILTIPDVTQFIKRLQLGNLQEIFSEKQDHYFYRPSSKSKMKKYCNEIYMPKLIDEAERSGPWIGIKYKGKSISGFTSREKLILHYSQSIHSLFKSIHSDFNNGNPTRDERPRTFNECTDFSDWFFFKIPNVKSAIEKFRKGDFKILDEIKNVEYFKDHFLPKCSDIQRIYKHDCAPILSKYKS